ncbi:hydrogenase formation protein HypD [Ferrimonas balearica]|uniref:hydrogenase formation protein HypD n=1 Tax=Ferrimonas balearica TaxID=44012 RepID=UPI001C99F5F2|nr:hydrogenase formation protein HypD [Ferrimonas balearica]MBY5921595.1 hydrogenase formation protein HypD [Ferrimonas balearica]MBY5995065.1 hydrogenase formation protein HypD [Ferrimonas balearica]
MKFVDEFRDPEAVKQLIAEIGRVLERVDPARQPLQIMEVCGGHTHAIFRFGLDKLLPKGIEFVHGPGCPVCVLPRGRIDDAITLARQPGTILCSYGDAVRVPGEQGSLLDAKAAGADVRIVYSPLDAMALAKQNPDRQVIFFAIGFETTAPATAITLMQARQQQVENFSVLCHHITIGPPLKAILDDPGVRLDGLVAPGHVSMVVGQSPYQFIVDDYGKPVVIAGFEPIDFLTALLGVVHQIAEGRAEVENAYTRAVQSAGNAVAQRAMSEVFTLAPKSDWRGLGAIDESGLMLSPAFAEFDAERRFGLKPTHVEEPEGCGCAKVLRGQIKPADCPLFGQRCTPQTPVGALMVSSEGACAAYFQYR